MTEETTNPGYWAERLSHHEKARLHYSVWLGDDIDRLTEIHQAAVKKHIPPGCLVIDFGCGYGRSYPWFRGRNRYVGVDFSPAFINKARYMFFPGEFKVGDILKGLPFPDKQFDWGISVGMERMFRNAEVWDKACKEMKRVAERVLVMDMDFVSKPYEL